MTLPFFFVVAKQTTFHRRLQETIAELKLLMGE
jgi:hypothetical protein